MKLKDDLNLDWRYFDVLTFNKIAGVFDTEDCAGKQIERAIHIFKSECKETIDAYHDKDSVELLEGVCDVFVTLSGLMQTMQHLGFDVEEALKRVCDNNLEKFPQAPETGPSAAQMLFLQPDGTTATYHQPANCYVYKDKNGKVKKPVGFKPVELQDLCPKDIWK